MRRFTTVVLAILGLVAGLAAAAPSEPWHHPLYLDGGGWWQGRVEVVVHNDRDVPADGEPVVIRVGSGPAEAALVGQSARAVRVTNAAGVEMLFALRDPQGGLLEDGPIPERSTLVIPAECPPHATAKYYVYFDNPAAGQVPDFLAVRPGIVNGDVEQGQGGVPDGWSHDPPDALHQASWSDEHPQSGKHCLKTVVAEGAEPTWIATRQHEIHIVGGAKYVMRAWVKADNVRGMAGWYIHVGDPQHPMMIAPMLDGGAGSYDWKEVRAEFTAPAGANRADLGTVLRGTGTAWFDNVTLECLQPGALRAESRSAERMDLRQRGADEPWPSRVAPDALACDRRAVVRVLNFSDEPLARPLVCLDVGLLEGRLRGRLNRQAMAVVCDGKPVPHWLDGLLMLFEGSVPARAVTDYAVYYSDDPRLKLPATSGYAALVVGDRNLVKNPSFEQGVRSPEGWSASGQGSEGALGGPDRLAPPGLGQQSVKLHVPHGVPKSWRGWVQNVAVRPGRTYLLAAWVKCDDLRGSLRVHAHRRNAAGELSKHSPMVSVGPTLRGTTDWTLLSGMITMPEDTVTLQVHLTTDGTGTVWHDGVVVAECVPGRVARWEGRPLAEGDGLRIWPVPAVVKVFGDDPAPAFAARDEQAAAPSPISSGARNERESLQWAIRSPKTIRNVRVEVDAPVGPGGAKLTDLDINVVGYVPIDHPTSYYQSHAPAWHRKVPDQPGQCDGWPGLWPDPLLPQNTLDLEANVTRAVWVTVGVGKDAPAGEYQGRLRLVCGAQALAEVPFRLRVWDFTLPDESHVAAIYDVRLGRHEELWGKSLDEIYPEIVRFMARRRLCPDTIRPGPTFQCKDDQITADFTDFDKAAAWYFDELKLPYAYTPWEFYLFGWGHPPKAVFGQKPYPGEPPYEGADRSRLRSEYKKVYQACLKTFWEHLRKKGWDKRVILYISDEPFDRHEHIRQQMKALCGMIHEVSPTIPIYSSTWHHVPDWDGYLDVWGIGHYGIVPPEKMAQLRQAGARIWFTTDGQMCTDTPYCAVERLLPHYCFKYGAEAYEFWGAAWLTYDPYRFGWHAYIPQSDEPGRSYWVRYPNGDGFLIYPGKPIGYPGLVSSIRLEQAREGVEDYEYLHLLGQLVAEAKAAGRDVAAAQEAMQRAAALVAIPNAGGRYSSKILPDPAQLDRVRHDLAAAIEQLTAGNKRPEGTSRP